MHTATWASHIQPATVCAGAPPTHRSWLHTISMPLTRTLFCAPQMGKNFASTGSSSASPPRSSRACSTCHSPQNPLPRSRVSTFPSPPTFSNPSSSTSTLNRRRRYQIYRCGQLYTLSLTSTASKRSWIHLGTCWSLDSSRNTPCVFTLWRRIGVSRKRRGLHPGVL